VVALIVPAGAARVTRHASAVGAGGADDRARVYRGRGREPADVVITAQHLRELFDSDLPDPHLVVVAGEGRVVPGPAGAEDGLVVASRADLLAQSAGWSMTGEALDQLARRLDTEVNSLGG
jgi:hypothetical protein